MGKVMTSILCLLAGGLLLGGCRPRTASPPTAALQSAEEQAAADLARQFLKRHGTPWGEPVKVWKDSEGEATYVLLYATPKDEIKVLGDRAVVVNVATKEVRFQPRD